MLFPVVRGRPWAPAAAVRSIRTAWALCGGNSGTLAKGAAGGLPATANPPAKSSRFVSRGSALRCVVHATLTRRVDLLPEGVAKVCVCV